ncbi:unnamed protein product [Meloidogyne enterolobii]|uniref:Uncharacterized protein n=1 Tax=Meloidogyne enterolobii TaxID=390850 RepID=A0ACB0Z0E5_MELEN
MNAGELLKLLPNLINSSGKLVGHPPQLSRPSSLFSICEVLPHLFIAGYASLEESKLHQLGITHCVDATNIPNTKRFQGIDYLYVPIDDSLNVDVTKYFQGVADFVRGAKQKGGKTVIYCAAGISRAATLTIMTLVINEGLTLREAYYTVVSARPIIAPNLAFWRQMIAWENEKNGKTTVHLLKGMRTPVPDVYLKKSDYMPPPESWEAPPKYTLTPKMGRKFNT